MNLTRRAFLASLAVCALSACSSDGGAAPASDKWHTIVAEGLQVSVPSDATLDEDATETLETIEATTYWIKGNDIVFEVDVLGDGDITGDFEVREANGMTVYVQEVEDGLTEAIVPHDGKRYCVIMFFNKNTGSKAAYENARDHAIESLRF